MKTSLNGVLHMSVLDGWWIEAYNGMNEWVFGNTAPGPGTGVMPNSSITCWSVRLF
jgi:glucan phosphorylase